MLKRILGLVILSFILSSYDPPGNHLAGVVVDKNTLVPIDSAQITILETNVLQTDSLGGFEIMWRGGIGSGFEIFVERKGYQSKFINFSEGVYNQDSAVIKLQPTNTVYKPDLSRNQLRLVNTLIKIVFSFLNVFTMIFILVKSTIRWKYLWIAGILFLNLIFNLFYLDYSLLNYEIIHAPFFLAGYWNNPYSVKIAVPLISLVFWVLYFSKSNLIKEGVIEIKNVSERRS